MTKEKTNFDQNQYDMLLRCSDRENLTEWNQWRQSNSQKDISFAGLDLSNRYLEDADLHEVLLVGTNLQGTHLNNAILKGAIISKADLRSADFTAAITDSGTLIWDCQIDKKTDFTGIGMNNIRIDPESKQLLQYNVRRMRWERSYKYKDWYDDKATQQRSLSGKLSKLPIRLFWQISDYGNSTRRIILSFLMISLAFAIIYAFFPSMIDGLSVEYDSTGQCNYVALRFVRPIYFSVVTMTTLGFGDMHANAQSLWGQVLLIVHVIFGYVLLGALVTRFAVMFQAGGPTLTHEIIKKSKKENKDQRENLKESEIN